MRKTRQRVEKNTGILARKSAQFYLRSRHFSAASQAKIYKFYKAIKFQGYLIAGYFVHNTKIFLTSYSDRFPTKQFVPPGLIDHH
jgi:hypothetical protein